VFCLSKVLYEGNETEQGSGLGGKKLSFGIKSWLQSGTAQSLQSNASRCTLNLRRRKLSEVRFDNGSLWMLNFSLRFIKHYAKHYAMKAYGGVDL
jgi:hypothetical protein